MSDLERRVTTLESDMKKLLQDTAEIKGLLRAMPTSSDFKDLKAMLAADIGELKGRVSGLPSAVEFGELKGRVNALPTTAKIASIVSIIGAMVAIILRWQEIVAFTAGVVAKH